VSDADADDLLQDLFVRIDTTTTGPIRSPRAYLYQMLNNLAHTRRRTEMRSEVRDEFWIGNQPGSKEALDPEAALLARDHLARVEDLINQLPERTATIFRAYRVEGRSQKAIAREIGISLSAVEKHLQRAYAAVLDIRERLEAALPPGRQAGGGSHDPAG
jgi:RNA polymerase sigma-70 factor (ECF subfamily)